MPKQMTYVSAMKDFFGLKDGQSNMDFVKELKALSPAEKDWFTANLPSVGYEVTTALAA